MLQTKQDNLSLDREFGEISDNFSLMFPFNKSQLTFQAIKRVLILALVVENPLDFSLTKKTISLTV